MDRRERGGTSQNEVLIAALQSWQAGMWTAMPGTVSKDMNAGERTVEVQVAIRARVQDKEGSFSWQALPVLLDCPVQFPSGGGCTLTFPVKAGDECLVVFASRCIDGWWQSGGVQNQPDLRKHDLSDGIALVGLNSKPKVISAISTTRAQLRSDDGQAFAEVDPSSHLVRVKTSGKAEVDAASDIDLKSATKITLAAPIISFLGNMTWAGVGGGAGTVSASNLNVTYTNSVFNYVGGSITHDGKNIGSTHTHGGVTAGGANTATPNP